MPPVSKAQRFESLDVLRGFALLGILVMNIQSFSMIGAAYMNPTAYGDLSGANYWVWFFSHLLADQKFISLFSMMFGAGIVLMCGRRRDEGKRSAGLHYRRMLGLLVIGLVHAYAFWPGDILVTYALCGMILYPFNKLGPRWLIVLGLLSMAVASTLMLVSGLTMPFWGEEAIDEFAADWKPSPETINKELEIYRGPWIGQMPDRAAMAFLMETFIFVIIMGWRCGGLMLIGMALMKTGVIIGERSRIFYGRLAGVGLIGGLTIVWFGLKQHEAHDWDIRYSFFLGSQYNYWASALVSLGYLGVVMLVCKSSFRWVTRPLAAVGRMALSNYLFQTVVATTLFYGHGFGWFGHASRVEQITIVVCIWTAQIILSVAWLSMFRFGPMEWLWRWASYGTRSSLV